MNSVDTGWINDENPLEKAALARDYDFQTPLDEIDAAARVIDPIMMSVKEGTRIWQIPERFCRDRMVKLIYCI